MNKKTKIIVSIMCLIFLIAIVIKTFTILPKLFLIKDVEEILENIKDVKYIDTSEIVIDNEYVINDKVYQVNGKGVIFIEENSSVMLSRNNMCAMKLPYSDKVMFQEEDCPNYRLVNGEKVIVKD